MTSIYEELIWRGGIFYFYNTPGEIIILSLIFSFLHLSKKISIRECLELIIFSLIEYMLLIYTQNIINCIIVHAIRNIFIILLDFSIKKEDQYEKRM